jgi:CubicO group peptidase (beta-lactamase class C family)
MPFFRYSNYGFAVLGHTLEEVFGGADWNSLVTKLILAPLNMNFTGSIFTPEVCLIFPLFLMHAFAHNLS